MKFATRFQVPSVKNEWIRTSIRPVYFHATHRYKFMYIHTIFRMFSCHISLVTTLNCKFVVEFPLSQFLLSTAWKYITYINILYKVFIFLQYFSVHEGTAVAQWLRCCATIRKVGSTVVKVLCYNSEGRWFDRSW